MQIVGRPNSASSIRIMTGKQLSDDHRAILSRLLQISKLNNHEVAWVLGVDERTVRRRRCEFQETGEIRKHKDVSKNAEKLKPHHLEKLIEWHKDHTDALLEDMQLFLRTQCGLEVSLPTISRQIRKAYGGTLLRFGRCARIRSRKQREAEGRSIALELQQDCGDDGGSSSHSNNDSNNEKNSHDDGNDDDDRETSGHQTYAAALFPEQRPLPPLEQPMGQPLEPQRELKP